MKIIINMTENNISRSSIKKLLNSKQTYVIPRYQRKYAWKNKNVELFLNDLFHATDIDNNSIKTNDYFIGITLLKNNKNSKPYEGTEIIDGQQRITTITMILSIIAKIFKGMGNEKEFNNTYKYICKSYNYEKHLILKNETSEQFFYDTIQNFNIEKKLKPETEEEKNIEKAYKRIEKYFNENDLIERYESKFNYFDILVAFREQLLKCFVFVVVVNTAYEAHTYFETLNGKGMELLAIDLVKNRIFEMCNATPTDTVKNRWNGISNILYGDDKHQANLQTFYHHFWNSKYSKETEKTLYSKFKLTIDDNQESYERFIEEMYYNAKNYMKIVFPKETDFQRKKECKKLVQSLISIDDFNVVLHRVPLMALLEKFDNKKLKLSKLIIIIEFLELFHFEYNAICNKTNNIVDKIYSNYSIKIRNCEDTNQIYKITNEELFDKLNVLLPKKDQFIDNFKKLEYEKDRNNKYNKKTRYAIWKLNCFYNNKHEFYGNESLEHIINEKNKGVAINIGNIICLEKDINESIPKNIEKLEQKKNYYKKSNYSWIKEFINETDSFEKRNIKKRASILAKDFYEFAAELLSTRI